MSKKKKNSAPNEQNFTHKYMVQFCTDKVFVDQKKELKKGSIKHKGRGWDSTSF